VTVEYIDVTPMSEPDPDWIFVDLLGHEHRYTADNTLPTLRVVTIDEGDNEHPGWSIHVCKLCGERVRPQHRPPRFRQFMKIGGF
jgi:hypothetical protein